MSDAQLRQTEMNAEALDPPAIAQEHSDAMITPRPRMAITSSRSPELRTDSSALMQKLMESEESVPCPSPNVFLLGLEKSFRRFDDAGFLRILILEDLDDNELYPGDEIPSKRHEVPFISRSGTPKKKFGLSSLDMTWYADVISSAFQFSKLYLFQFLPLLE
jgi:hypothetical protein